MTPTEVTGCISLSQSLNRSPMSTGCPEVEGLMMKRRGEGLFSPPFSLHTPVWAWLSQSARYKVALTCRQPWGGARLLGTHRQAWHREGARCPYQDRLGPGPQALLQDKTKASDSPRLSWPMPMPAMKAAEEEQYKIVYLNLFCFTDEKLRPRARRHLPGVKRRT